MNITRKSNYETFHEAELVEIASRREKVEKGIELGFQKLSAISVLGKQSKSESFQERLAAEKLRKLNASQVPDRMRQGEIEGDIFSFAEDAESFYHQ